MEVMKCSDKVNSHELTIQLFFFYSFLFLLLKGVTTQPLNASIKGSWDCMYSSPRSTDIPDKKLKVKPLRSGKLIYV